MSDMNNSDEVGNCDYTKRKQTWLSQGLFEGLLGIPPKSMTNLVYDFINDTIVIVTLPDVTVDIKRIVSIINELNKPIQVAKEED